MNHYLSMPYLEVVFLIGYYTSLRLQYTLLK